MTGTFLLTQAVCRVFEEQGSGNIINICSTYGLMGPDQRIYNEGEEMTFVKPITYSVTKSAVLGFTRYLAAYYRGRNIRVNALTPGGVERDHDEDFVRRSSAKTILGRMARPHELTGAPKLGCRFSFVARLWRTLRRRDQRHRHECGNGSRIGWCRLNAASL